MPPIPILKPNPTDEYFTVIPDSGRAHLTAMRLLLRSVAPDATECLKWGQPVFEQGTILFAYAAHKSI